jgi:hypothetical protein
MTKMIKHVADIYYKGTGKLFTFGLPLPKGKATAANALQLFHNNELLSAHFTVVGFWDDSTIRWLRCQAIIKQSGVINISLNHRDDIPQSESIINNDTTVYPKNVLIKAFEESLTASIRVNVRNIQGPLNLVKKRNISTITPLSEITKMTGAFHFNNRRLKLYLHIENSKNTGDVFIKLRLHNPHAAAHFGGQWDLGDSNSIRIEDFSLTLQLDYAKASVQINETSLEAHKPFIYKEDYKLDQHSSGGKNWQSPIHWNEHKKTTVHKHGFQLINKKNIIHQGLRAEPIGVLKNKANIFKMELEGFWQNFPISLTGEKDALSWKLLAKDTELQGGESKTWLFNCKLEKPNNESKLDDETSKFAIPKIIYNPLYLTQCEILPHIGFSSSKYALTSLINKGLNSDLKDENDFFKKREKNDIYGWRHYGELDADHEAVNAPKNSYFISHYNNQYDPLMGMTLQFLHHGELKWLELLRPLNQHIQDIDIYDTQEDKAEYNGGLMWHTDHYLSAETCTHRSNSKYHTYAYDGFLGGGGPGGQQCYTTGLTLQYWLFGDDEAKAKVVQLCSWIRNCYDGSGSIAERTFRLLTIDFKKYVLTNIGVKAPGYKYPLDRGTGNFLIALLDHYDLCEAPELLKEMGQVIKQTFHPLENISLRSLNDHENSWFYTVFLQAVVRYLLLKESRNTIDDDYWYARHGFMHYCNWMIDNECFYLEYPEKLEFPNDTWCAQELRKANLFYFAYYFSEDNHSRYIKRAEEFYQYVTNHLSHSKEAHYTRILAILMQNNGVQQKFKNKPTSPISYEIKQYSDAPSFSRKNIILTYMKDIKTLLLNFSPKSEWSWLTQRLSRVFNKS